MFVSRLIHSFQCPPGIGRHHQQPCLPNTNPHQRADAANYNSPWQLPYELCRWDDGQYHNLRVAHICDCVFLVSLREACFWYANPLPSFVLVQMIDYNANTE